MNKTLKIDGLLVTVKYRKKMKNIYLRIEKNGEVVVSTPPRTPNYLVKKLVYANFEEIIKRKNNIVKNIPEKREFKTGEIFFVFGKELKIEVIVSNRNGFNIVEDKIILAVKDEFQDREKLFYKGIRAELYKQGLYFIKKYEGLMSVNVNELRIKKMKTRWGTCNIKACRIWINEELVKYPISCLEHIVVHELTHLLETNHTKRFYEILGHYYPNYRENDRLIKDFCRLLAGR